MDYIIAAWASPFVSTGPTPFSIRLDWSGPGLEPLTAATTRGTRSGNQCRALTQTEILPVFWKEAAMQAAMQSAPKPVTQTPATLLSTTQSTNPSANTPIEPAAILFAAPIQNSAEAVAQPGSPFRARRMSLRSTARIKRWNRICSRMTKMKGEEG